MTAMTAPERTALQRFFFNGVFSHWVKNVYLREPDADRREAMKLRYMSGTEGRYIADGYWNEGFDRTRIMGDIPIDEAMPVYPTLDRLLETAPQDTIILQLGSCSGREVAHFAQRFPRFTFVGTDIDRDMISDATARYALPNLTFSLAAAHNSLAAIPVQRQLIVFSVTSCQYVQPEHLTSLMQQIAARPDTTLLLSETWEAGGLDLIPGKTRWRASFSYSHEYDAFAREAGLQIVESRKISNHTSAAHRHKKSYFLYARAPDHQVAI